MRPVRLFKLFTCSNGQVFNNKCEWRKANCKNAANSNKGKVVAQLLLLRRTSEHGNGLHVLAFPSGWAENNCDYRLWYCTKCQQSARRAPGPGHSTNRLSDKCARTTMPNFVRERTQRHIKWAQRQLALNKTKFDRDLLQRFLAVQKMLIACS